MQILIFNRESENMSHILLYSHWVTSRISQFRLYLGGGEFITQLFSKSIVLNSHHTRLPYPPPYELAKNCQRYWNHGHKICNIESSILGWFFISYKYHSDQQKNQFPAHFRCTKFWKFYFRFSFTASKDAEFNFRGSPKGDFQDPRMLCASNVDFWPLRQKNASSYGDC